MKSGTEVGAVSEEAQVDLRDIQEQLEALRERIAELRRHL